jgi:hypothetical protein
LSEYKFMPNIDFVSKNEYTVKDPLPIPLMTKYKFLKVTPRNSIVYDRKDQVVAREIFIFQNGIVEEKEEPTAEPNALKELSS